MAVPAPYSLRNTWQLTNDLRMTPAPREPLLMRSQLTSGVMPQLAVIVGIAVTDDASPERLRQLAASRARS